LVTSLRTTIVALGAIIKGGSEGNSLKLACGWSLHAVPPNLQVIVVALFLNRSLP